MWVGRYRRSRTANTQHMYYVCSPPSYVRAALWQWWSYRDGDWGAGHRGRLDSVLDAQKPAERAVSRRRGHHCYHSQHKHYTGRCTGPSDITRGAGEARSVRARLAARSTVSILQRLPLLRPRPPYQTLRIGVDKPVLYFTSVTTCDNLLGCQWMSLLCE